MEKKDLRIVYMGTPEFAVESDKPMGRHGSVLQPSPVKAYAVSQGLKVLQPEKLKDEAFLEELRALRADLQIVVAFRMLPEAVWQMPRLGTFNLHASLLPQYRGAAPINWIFMLHFCLNTAGQPQSIGRLSTARRKRALRHFS